MGNALATQTDASSPKEESAETKSVFLVRHAQSQQNVATARFFEHGDAAALGMLLRLGYDAPLSDAGQSQLEDAAKKLDGRQEKSFAERNGVELVACSPYSRAADTAAAIFPRFANFCTLPALVERSVTEYFFPQRMDARIDEVKSWLDGRQEKVIALVGHGQFFKRCMGKERPPGMGSGEVQANVSIIKCTYSATAGFRDCQLAFDGYRDPAAGKRTPRLRSTPTENMDDD